MKYTVVTIDPSTQWHTSRLGRWVSKREAMRIADMWERNGSRNVCVLDERGTIHIQLGNMPATLEGRRQINPANRNRSGTRRTTKLNTDGRGYPVFGAAYGSRMQLARNSFLTHAADFNAEKVVCGKVKFENVMEDNLMSEQEPSCPICRKRLGLP
jgi:hypothetical protein